MSENVESKFIFDYWPTGTCDMKCPFCYGAQVPDFSQLIQDQTGSRKAKMYLPAEDLVKITGNESARAELDTDQAKGVLRLMNKVGGNAVTIAGGEPLIRTDTPEIIEYAKQDLGMTVYLSTDGTYVLGRYAQFKDNIDVLGMPIDGSNTDVNVRMGRRPYLFKNISAILEYFQENQPSHIVKLGTVVSRKNIDDIENIGRFLFETPGQYRPDVWRLYQFESIGRGRVNADSYVVSDTEFSQVCDEMERKFPDAEIRPRSNAGSFNAYFFVTPDGVLKSVNSSNHVSIVDLRTIDEQGLRGVLAEYGETVSRANRNRNWLPQYT